MKTCIRHCAAFRLFGLLFFCTIGDVQHGSIQGRSTFAGALFFLLIAFHSLCLMQFQSLLQS